MIALRRGAESTGFEIFQPDNVSVNTKETQCDESQQGILKSVWKIADLDEIAKKGLKISDDIWGMCATGTMPFLTLFDEILFEVLYL